MRKAFMILLSAASILASLNSLAQSAGDYRSNVLVGGNWAAAANWERHNGTTWVAAVTAPSASDGVITILAGDLIEITAATTIDQVVVEPNGQLSIYSLVTPFVCTLANGAGTDLTNNGTLVVSVNATFSGAGTLVNSSGASFIASLTTTLSVSTTNNGTMLIDNTASFVSNTVINYGTFSLQNSTLNLNNASLINHGLITFPAIGDSFISGTGGGIFLNDIDGTLFKNSAIGVARIDPNLGTVAFTNLGVLKGTGDFSMRSTVTNTGTISPGDNGAGILLVSPAFVTTKAPTFRLDIVSSGGLAGINYDRASFSNVDVTTVTISGSTLTVTDNGSDIVGTTYTLFTSLSTIAGTFATVNLPPTLGNLTYNANTITVQKTSLVNRYTWIGGNSSWTTAGNWFPSRTIPAATDVLTFNTGTTITLTNVPTESVGMLNITNNTTVNLQAATPSKTLTIGNGSQFYLNVDPGSTLRSLNNAGVVLNLNIAPGARAVVGGVVDMQNGTFNVGDNQLILHTTAVPLTKTAGQFTLGSNGSIAFGDALNTSGPPIVFGSSIFVSSPVINRISVLRTNGAVLGDQDITVNQAVLSLGNLTTNVSAHLKFSTTATSPVESATSKIIGYADMLPRVIGTSALNFLGASIAAGATVGTVSISRITGPSGINTFNGYSSIAAKWNITASTEPSPARTISFSWLSDFDNSINTALQFQDYRYDTGPNWVSVGSLAVLASAANPRVTAPAATIKLTGSWTIADQLNVLPIVLGSFDGKQIDNSVVLNWKTLSELNGDYFEVQRLLEDEEQFSVLGTVSAHGTTKEVHQYSFTDEHAVSGRNYYRLKLVDFDKSFDHSKIIQVSYTSVLDFNIFPNPGTGEKVTLTFPEAKRGLINIYDLTHRKILTRVVEESDNQLMLSGMSLAAGMYIVTYESSGALAVKKLIVQH